MNPENRRTLEKVIEVGKQFLRMEADRATAVAKEEAHAAGTSIAFGGAAAMAGLVGITGLVVSAGMALTPHAPKGAAIASGLFLVGGAILGILAVKQVPRPHRMLQKTVGAAVSDAREVLP